MESGGESEILKREFGLSFPFMSYGLEWISDEKYESSFLSTGSQGPCVSLIMGSQVLWVWF